MFMCSYLIAIDDNYGLNSQIFTLLEKVAVKMSFAELYNATKCFNMKNIIGFGKMGMMYEARLLNG